MPDQVIARTNKGGRPKKEPTGEWKDKFVADMLKYNGNRSKAAAESPYSFTYILMMLDKNNDAYDEQFAEKVRECELSISAAAEEVLVSAALAFSDGLPDNDTAKTLDIAARISEKVVQKLDSDRWGKKVDLRHSGEVKHNHMLGSREERLAIALRAQQEFFGSKGIKVIGPLGNQEPLALPAAVDAEYVEVKTRKKNARASAGAEEDLQGLSSSVLQTDDD